MSDDPRYPQYRIYVNWTEDGDDGERCENATTLLRMYREDPGEDEVRREVREDWWPKFVQAERRAGGTPIGERDPSEPVIEVTYKGEESWCLSWFEHWTFDVGQSDAEALDSFERYVRRYEHMQDPPLRDIPDDYRCLMGAEDRWRWTGGPSPDDRTAPPCRCEHCREQGVIRIGH